MVFYRYLFVCLLMSQCTYGEPPRSIPPHLYNDFTLNNTIPVVYWYINNTQSPGAATIYKEQDIEDLIRKVGQGHTFHYGSTDDWLYQALSEYSIAGKTVAIMGSEKPVYEAICLYYQGKPTTIEYKKIISNHPQLTCVTVDEFDKNPMQFDAAFSISSFEHDGLGRYGDPIDPFGDFKAMKKMKRIVKKDGLLFLSVPIGKDTLAWNAMRLYGRIRLPLLLKGWELIDSFGYSESLMETNTVKAFSQPVLVLKNK